MQWRGRRTSTNVEDRRGIRLGGGAGLGCGGLLIVIVLAWLTGANPLELFTAIQQTQPQLSPDTGSVAQPHDELSQFVSVVLADTEDTWNQIFRDMGRRYEEPTLVLFSNSVSSACGLNSAAVGPFYCPADGKLYIDLSFFQALDRRFGAPGDFAQAYVIAHEVGHHVQNLLGISDQVHSAQQRARSQSEANELSVRLELQADCLAGVWGHYANRQRQLLDPDDLQEGLDAAAAVGDDTIQQRSGGRVAPESWTHGSSSMRVAWFRRGYQSGDPNSCDTFGRPPQAP